MAFFQENLGKPAPERQTILDFTGARDNGVAVASSGPYANHLHLAPDRFIMERFAKQREQFFCDHKRQFGCAQSTDFNQFWIDSRSKKKKHLRITAKFGSLQ